MRFFGRVLLLLVIPTIAGPSAYAHGDLDATFPKAGSKVGAPIDHLAITFTEAPTEDSAIKVLDGCKDNIVDRFEIEDRVAHVYTAGGQPGKWTVSYRTISSVDGHLVKGSYRLQVSGQPDCSAPERDEETDGPEAGDNGETEPPRAGGNGEPGPEEEGGSSFPLLPVALGSAAVIGAALLIRRTAQ
ncbi:MAG: copper resistance protein CopC [Actinomycetota bacterium]|nr:copper resistance protein CopC [Actinomycetota bacterium]